MGAVQVDRRGWISLKVEPMVFVHGWGLGREKDWNFLAHATRRMELTSAEMRVAEGEGWGRGRSSALGR